MGRSAIVVKVGNKYKGVYCHNNGDHYGKNSLRVHLYTSYNSQEMAESLVELGDLSIVQGNIAPPEGIPHTFDAPLPNVTVAYVRDRGDDRVESAVRSARSVKGITDYIDHEYVYLFKDGQWTVRRYDRKKGIPLFQFW